MTKCYYTIFVLLICIPFSIEAQQKENFNLTHNDKIIGAISAIKTVDGAKTTYTDDTYMEAHFLYKIKVVYDYDEIYIDGNFSESFVTIVINGHEHSRTSTTKKNSMYSFTEDDDSPEEITQTIGYSTMQLLFEEPIGVSSVYSAEHGNFHILKKTGEHSYLKTTPEGHKNSYYYSNGSLQKADIHAGAISFLIQRK